MVPIALPLSFKQRIICINNRVQIIHKKILMWDGKEWHKPFDKMAAGVESVIFREFDMANHKSPSSGMILYRSRVLKILYGTLGDWQSSSKYSRTNLRTAMKNCSAKIVSFCAKRECEEDRTKLKLHGYEADNGLQPWEKIKKHSQEDDN